MIWGAKNFERDDALNVLDWWYMMIIEDIKKTFKRENQGTLYEDYGESRIIANIDILLTLMKHYGVLPNLTPEEVIHWKENYLQTFDRTINKYDPVEGYVEERKQVIAETFDSLHALIKELLDD